MSQNGLGGVVNEALAFASMRDAARQGHGLAQHGLGVMYLYGECVAKDETEAAGWFRRAAGQGLAGAMMTLGMMYEQGLGVERDPEQAGRLYAQAESVDSGLMRCNLPPAAPESPGTTWNPTGAMIGLGMAFGRGFG